jgi:hypothetical protein
MFDEPLANAPGVQFLRISTPIVRLPQIKPQNFWLGVGAGDGNRTQVCSLGSWIETSQINALAAKQDQSDTNVSSWF